MATDRVPQTPDYLFTAWGFQRRGWGRLPRGPLTRHQTAREDPLFLPAPVPGPKHDLSRSAATVRTEGG